jgi:hypothetical protein
MNWFTCAGFAGWLLAGSALCHADTVAAPYWHLPGSDTKDAYIADDYWNVRLGLRPDGTPGGILPGGILNFGTPSPAGVSFLDFAFCVEPYVFASGASAVGTVGQGGYFAQAATPTVDVQHLYNLYYAQVLTSATTPVVRGSAEELAARKLAYAFQVALWEMQTDDSNVTSGSLTTTGAMPLDPVLSQASAMMAAARNTTGPSQYQFTIWNHPDYQDYLVASAAPEPATLGLLLSGLGTLVWSRKRRRQ